jgi:hypothetical protein
MGHQRFPVQRENTNRSRLPHATIVRTNSTVFRVSSFNPRHRATDPFRLLLTRVTINGNHSHRSRWADRSFSRPYVGISVHVVHAVIVVYIIINIVIVVVLFLSLLLMFYRHTR